MARLPKQERSAGIVAAAVEVMSREGVQAATTRRIAREAGVPVSSIHYCFGGKDGLTDAVLGRIVEQIHDTASADLDGAGSLSDAIGRMARSFWALVEADAGLQTMQYELTLAALRSRRSAGFARRQYEQYAALAEGLFATAAERAGERSHVPLAELARFLVAGLDGLILQHLADPDLQRSRAGVERIIAATCALADEGERSIEGGER